MAVLLGWRARVVLPKAHRALPDANALAWVRDRMAHGLVAAVAAAHCVGCFSATQPGGSLDAGLVPPDAPTRIVHLTGDESSPAADAGAAPPPLACPPAPEP